MPKLLTDIIDVDIEYPKQTKNGKWPLIVRYYANNNIDLPVAGAGCAFESYADRAIAGDLITLLIVDMKHKAEEVKS